MLVQCVTRCVSLFFFPACRLPAWYLQTDHKGQFWFLTFLFEIKDSTGIFTAARHCYLMKGNRNMNGIILSVQLTNVKWLVLFPNTTLPDEFLATAIRSSSVLVKNGFQSTVAQVQLWHEKLQFKFELNMDALIKYM